MQIHDLVPVLQLSVGPVIVISSVALLLLSITNRFGRAIDRSRYLTELLKKSPAEVAPNLRSQLAIISGRARLLRMSIIFAGVTLLQAALLIIGLFLVTLLEFEVGGIIVALFIGCMLTLIASIVVFMVDINTSLKALDVEIASVQAP